MQNRKITFESCSFRFLLIKAFCLGFQKVSNCQGWNVELENPPTQKCQDDVSRGNFVMYGTPNITAGRSLSLYANGIIPNSKWRKQFGVEVGGVSGVSISVLLNKIFYLLMFKWIWRDLTKIVDCTRLYLWQLIHIKIMKIAAM